VSEYPDLKATHWRSESIYHATVETGFLDYQYAEVSTDAEVPMAGEVRVCATRAIATGRPRSRSKVQTWS
jgi:hypothetical protein